MQPDGSNVTHPDYSFLNEQPKKTIRLPLDLNSPVRKAIALVIAFIIVWILFTIIRSALFPPPFSESDYLLLTERQQEIRHILSVDVTSADVGQLSTGDQEFAATAYLSLGTAQNQTLSYMADYKDKVNPTTLAKVYSDSIDQEFSNSLETNTFDSFFDSEMQAQFSYYEQELTTSYNSTKPKNVGRSLLRSEYDEAELLVKALNSPAS